MEAVFHSVRTFHQGKLESPEGIRSSCTWFNYKPEWHDFADFLKQQGKNNLLDSESVRDGMSEYLLTKLDYCVFNKHSRQTFEKKLAALGKLQYAINTYIQIHSLDLTPLDVRSIRLKFYSQSKLLLNRSSRLYDNRAYPDPLLLISAIRKGTYRLQAALQFEGGLRAEGVGAPGHRRFKNPLTKESLRGTGPDPVTGQTVGYVASVEKGGKETLHYITLETYHRLEGYIQVYGMLVSHYKGYTDAINQAARDTGQYAEGRGSHGLKHNFAQRRQRQCIAHGMTQKQAEQQTSLETSHFRLSETVTYTRGPK
jgi:integrase